MQYAIKAPPMPGAIFVLGQEFDSSNFSTSDRPRTHARSLEGFGLAPLDDAPAAPRRLIQEALEWAKLRVERLRLEEQIALQEEFRVLRPVEADELRLSLAALERRLGEASLGSLMEEFAAVRRVVFSDDDEGEWT